MIRRYLTTVKCGFSMWNNIWAAANSLLSFPSNRKWNSGWRYSQIYLQILCERSFCMLTITLMAKVRNFQIFISAKLIWLESFLEEIIYWTEKLNQFLSYRKTHLNKSWRPCSFTGDACGSRQSLATHPTAATQQAAQDLHGPLVATHQVLQLSQVLRLFRPVSAVSR